MDDSKIKSLLDRKNQKAKQGGTVSEGHYKLAEAGKYMMFTLKAEVEKKHFSLAYHTLTTCHLYQNGAKEGLEINNPAYFARIHGRGLAKIHQALMERTLVWVRVARSNEQDDGLADVFVTRIEYGPLSAPASGAKPTAPKK